MEPLRVLELYSGIGGMHQALRGDRAPTASLFPRAPPLGRAAAPGLLGRRGAGGGARGGGWGRWLSWKPLWGCGPARRSGRDSPPRLQRCPKRGLGSSEDSACESCAVNSTRMGDKAGAGLGRVLVPSSKWGVFRGVGTRSLAPWEVTAREGRSLGPAGPLRAGASQASL